MLCNFLLGWHHFQFFQLTLQGIGKLNILLLYIINDFFINFVAWGGIIGWFEVLTSIKNLNVLHQDKKGSNYQNMSKILSEG
jgi:hypothetical protein